MKITPSQWIKLVQLISTFIIGVITALTVQSCTASMSVFWKNQNSKQDIKNESDCIRLYLFIDAENIPEQ